MRVLCLVFAVLLLVSLATPGYGQVLKYCPEKVGYCSAKCSKGEIQVRSSNCKVYCCLPPPWKWK